MSGLSLIAPPPVPVTSVHWKPAVRIIPSRFPTIYLFDRVASHEDFDALYALEAMTNDRVRDEIGELARVPKEERLFGPGSGPIMAAFTHLNPHGSRFSDGSYGVFYAARHRDTAIAETQYHQGRFLRATSEGPMQLQMRAYSVEVRGDLHDVREWPDPSVHSPDSYTASQALGRALQAAGSMGICYRSVRHEGGECVGVFRPRVLKNCQHAEQLLYDWDGERFTGVFEKIQ